MSLYSSLTQVLAPFAAKINGLLTGWDGTRYSTPGEAVRRQITDLHVLIGDEPGTAIQSSAVAYGEDGNVEDALDELNEGLTTQGYAIGDPTNLRTEDKTSLVGAVNELIGGGGSSWSAGAVEMLTTILQAGIYESDQTGNILQLKALISGGIPVSITYSLTGVDSSNSATSVKTGKPYYTVLTPTDPTHSMVSVSVTMDGTDVTNTVYDSTTGEIDITSVFGPLVITARAAYIALLYDWDLTDSLVDKRAGLTAITNATQNSDGVIFTAQKQYIAFTNSVNFIDKTIEIDISSKSTYNGSSSDGHSRLVAFSTNSSYNTNNATSAFGHNKTQGQFEFYLGSAWDTNVANVGRGYFNGKTMRVYLDTTRHATVSVSSDGGQTFEPVITSAGVLSTYTGLIIGSSGADSSVGLVISGVRIYEGEVA